MDRGKDLMPITILLHTLENTKEDRRSAAVMCACNATDGEDLLVILRMLGLVDGTGPVSWCL